MSARPLCLWAGTLGGHDLITRVRAASEAGYAAVSAAPTELVGAVEADDARAVRGALADTGVTLACLDPVATWVPNAVAAHPAHKAHARVSVRTCLELAERFGIPLLNAVDVTWCPLGGAARDGFAALAAAAAASGTAVAVEPQVYSGVPDVRTAVEFCSHAGNGTALLVDLWHLNRMCQPPDLSELPVAAVQLADGPLRAASDPVMESITARLSPGEGEFDLVGQMRALRIPAEAPVGPELFGAAVPAAATIAHAADTLAATCEVLADVAPDGDTPSKVQEVTPR